VCPMVRDARCGSVTALAGRSIKRYADPTRLGERRGKRAVRQDGLGCRADAADRALSRGASSKGRAPLQKRFGQLLLVVPREMGTPRHRGRRRQFFWTIHWPSEPGVMPRWMSASIPLLLHGWGSPFAWPHSRDGWVSPFAETTCFPLCGPAYLWPSRFRRS